MIKQDPPLAQRHARSRGQGLSLGDCKPIGGWQRSADHYALLRRDFATLVETALDRSGARPADIRTARQVAGLVSNCRPYGALISHQGVREQAGELLYCQLNPMLHHTAGGRWFFATLITDLGNSLEFAPVLELGRLKRQVWKMLDLVGLHFVGVIELQLARYPFQGCGRTVEAHAHVIGYLDNPALTARQAVRTITSRSTLRNWLGAPVANLQPVTTSDELRHWCRYMFKAPVRESRLSADPRQRSGFQIGHGNTDCWGALRLVELLAGITLRQATFARRELVKSKGQWIRDVETWVEQRPARREPIYAKAFDRVWERSPTKHPRSTPDFRFDARHPLDTAWSAAMREKIAIVVANQSQFDAPSRRSVRTIEPAGEDAAASAGVVARRAAATSRWRWFSILRPLLRLHHRVIG